MKTLKTTLFAFVSFAIIAASCSSMSKSQKGAAIGTAGGAVVGGVIGRASGNTALGAIIGAAVGGGAGAIIGKKMDKQAKEIQKDVPNAKVERVGEGITVEFSNNILFSINSAVLSPAAYGTLTDLITILNKYPDTNIEVQGHTDDTGSDSYNQTLSEKRASTVADYLLAHGILSSRVTTKGFGETAPKYPNDSEVNRAKNRHVEFMISANDKMKNDAKTEAGPKQ